MTPESTTPSGNNPSTTDDFIDRGWIHHVNGEHADAEASFRKALESNSQSIEAYYGLGMALKTQNQLQPALEAFEKVIALINADQMKDNPARASILRNLAQTQIQFIRRQAEPHP
jgi:tetratricopeptide (TPR) repeat protein